MAVGRTVAIGLAGMVRVQCGFDEPAVCISPVRLGRPPFVGVFFTFWLGEREFPMLNELSVSITGVSPLLMHNGQTADPLNKFSKAMKEVSGKRKKTDEDYAELSRIEWLAGLYVNESEKLILPSISLEAAIIDGAKKSKLGKAFKSSVFVNDDAVLNIGTKYKVASELWKNEAFRDVRGVRIGQSRVMRTRPIFREWSSSFVVMYDDEQVNLGDVQRALVDAGRISGVGDFRPKFGRFDVAISA